MRLSYTDYHKANDNNNAYPNGALENPKSWLWGGQREMHDEAFRCQISILSSLKPYSQFLNFLLVWLPWNPPFIVTFNNSLTKEYTSTALKGMSEVHWDSKHKNCDQTLTADVSYNEDQLYLSAGITRSS